ncbi:aquaporin-like protein [Melampsora americana]|nr:aquaporin-like protein [Melampsora americana]
MNDDSERTDQLPSSHPPSSHPMLILLIHCIAEALGVFLYVLPGEAATAAFILSTANDRDGFGSLLNIAFAYTCGIIIGIILTGHVSGSHLSPGVTLTFALLRGFPKRRVLPYIVFQLLGSIIATLVIYSIYGQDLNLLEDSLRLSGRSDGIISSTGPAAVGAFFPRPNQNLGRVFFGEFIASAILGLLIFGAIDLRNPLTSRTSIPFIIGIGYFIAIISFGPNTVVLNTARGLGGQIATSMIYGNQVFSNHRYMALATLTNIPATILGGLVYKLISWHYEEAINANPVSNPTKETSV